MVEMLKKDTSYWWWFDSHQSSRRSPWLQSTLGELDRKTKAMLKLIEEDADSFAQLAEMYYKKRPELISMVEDFYRTHRALAERYDQLKSDSGNRLLAMLGSQFSTKYQLQKFMNGMDQTYDNHSETYDSEDAAESEVEDPEQIEETELDEGMGDVVEPHKAESCMKQNPRKPRKHTARFRGPGELREVAAESGKAPDGDIANTGPAAGSIRSGFGGLGLEGIVGSDDSAGEGTPAPVVGNTGSMSGDKLGGEDKGASGKNAGAADIVENCTCTRDVKAGEEK